MKTWDVAIVGGGILGLATALSLSERFEGLAIVILEKEGRVASHQSGRNSGVIHSGLYYRPGSLKAKLCTTGAERLVAFCGENDIPYTRDGKVVVATSVDQLPALNELERRGKANGLRGMRKIDPRELGELEPHASGIAGLHVPSTGTVDFGTVTQTMASLLQQQGTEIITSFEVRAIDVTTGAVELRSDGQMVTARSLVNCAGLHADHIAELMGVVPSVHIVPFRGEYYDIGGASAALVNSCIYPVPDARLPFLGVHVTRAVDGSVHAGPNAVLAFAREGYRWSTVHPRELGQVLGYRGFRTLMKRHWRTGFLEMYRSASKRRFVASARTLVPEVHPDDFSRGRSGVRAQAVAPNGDLVDDFVLETTDRAVHVLNAPSPGATASLAIADYLRDRIAAHLDLQS